MPPARGRTVDEHGRGIRASIRVRATHTHTSTGRGGYFRIHLPQGLTEADLCASAPGYYIRSARVRPGEAVTIQLEPYVRHDCPEYQWVSSKPNPDRPENCGNCHHGEFYQEWASSTHARSAVNPQFLDLWNGTDARGRRSVHPGLLLDGSPLSPICASCHVPTLEPGETLAYDINRATGVAREGVHCDFCHKIRDVDTSVPGVKHGIMGIRLCRPGPERQIFFGGHDDVVTPTSSAVCLPLYRKSRICEPCHEGEIRGLPIYSTHSEWKRTTYARKGVECQTCHLAPDGRKRNFAPGHGGVDRPTDTVPSHDCPGSHDLDLHRRSVNLALAVKRDLDVLHVSVRVTPVDVGHSLPTGYPMRNIILWIRAQDESGRMLEQTQGPRIPDYGGRGGPADGGYAGQPGKVFAKVLCGPHGEYPVPTWRADGVFVDNRLISDTADESHYAFRFDSQDLTSTVTATLLFRQFFKSVIDAKGWRLSDMVMAEEQAVAAP